MNERRHTRRRQLPFVRSGVLEIEGRNHIVSVSDIGPDGAFVTTRLDLPLGERLILKMILPRESRPLPLPAHVVWRSEATANGRQRGLALRFRGLGAGVVRSLEEFAAESPLLRARRPSFETFEYCLVESKDVEVVELNRLGLEGWELATTLGSKDSFRLVFMRRREG